MEQQQLMSNKQVILRKYVSGRFPTEADTYVNTSNYISFKVPPQGLTVLVKSDPMMRFLIVDNSHHRMTKYVHYGSAPTDANFDPEPDPESGSSFDDPDPDYDDDDPNPDSEDDPHSDDDPNPEFVSDSDPDPDFDSDSGPDSGSDSDPNSYSTCILCIFCCTDYDF
ncbi:hypothetical protein L3X38_040582 [Prunus dulcis]|uniref:Uncharacterized protein n=1 Tax=Prunus dulcis TaxID=3755 RepID=A0AAD4YTM5_PRUDU|nr:hypothetical protein L3X38_040582 [Prunus dulcis]